MLCFNNKLKDVMVLVAVSIDKPSASVWVISITELSSMFLDTLNAKSCLTIKVFASAPVANELSIFSK